MTVTCTNLEIVATSHVDGRPRGRTNPNLALWMPWSSRTHPISGLYSTSRYERLGGSAGPAGSWVHDGGKLLALLPATGELFRRIADRMRDQPR